MALSVKWLYSYVFGTTQIRDLKTELSKQQQLQEELDQLKGIERDKADCLTEVCHTIIASCLWYLVGHSSNCNGYLAKVSNNTVS